MYAGKPNRLAVVHHGAADRLFDPVARVSAEPRIHRAIKPLHSPHQPQIPFLDQILQIQSFTQISPRDVNH